MTPTETGSTTEPAVTPTDDSATTDTASTPTEDEQNNEETGVLASTGAQQTLLVLAIGALLVGIGSLIVRSSRIKRKH